MEKTLYVSDLDGTLLTPEQRLSPFTVRVLEYLLGQGVAFTYATARSLYSSGAVTQGLTKRLPVILYNGAFVRWADTGEDVASLGFSTAQRQAVEKILESRGLSPLVYTVDRGAERVRHGAQVCQPEEADGTYRIYGPEEEFLALGRVEQGKLHIIKRFFDPT